MKISERIKKYREENPITQQELADKLYVSKQAISKWENDKSLPDISMYPTIASLLNISVDELMGNETTRPRLRTVRRRISGRARDRSQLSGPPGRAWHLFNQINRGGLIFNNRFSLFSP